MIQSADVRDLDQEGVIGNINLSQAWSSGVQDAFENAARDMRIHGLTARVERLEEVLESFIKKQKGGLI